MGLPSVSLASLVSPLRQVPLQTSQWPWSYRARHYPRWIDRSSARPVAFTGEAQGDRREQTRQGPTGPDRARQGREVRNDRSKRFQANISVEQEYVHYMFIMFIKKFWQKIVEKLGDESHH